MRAPDTTIREMIERAIELARRYAVWWQLVNKTSFAVNEAVVNDHEDFFATTTQALFESFIVITYQLYERRRDTISIPSLIADLPESDEDLAKKLDSKVDSIKPQLVKAFAIRCGVYAHRSKKEAPETIFSAMGLSAAEMKKVVDVTTEIIARLASAAAIGRKEEIVNEIWQRGTYAGDDTFLLMGALREHAL